ncbi:Thrombospondin type-1 domain-containing protein 7A [Portunus trituberculatus]|uniref:Thrombospondin type-1 domain-containing protein 7A n=1 Tax=Portunus trituberculatus TaxID=210409 RepID=A0A5B7HVJ6_PORTR|nr:Thrombospondin type-1 domain-containing protein 7A [Portunus trituberculatus]
MPMFVTAIRRIPRQIAPILVHTDLTIVSFSPPPPLPPSTEVWSIVVFVYEREFPGQSATRIALSAATPQFSRTLFPRSTVLWAFIGVALREWLVNACRCHRYVRLCDDFARDWELCHTSRQTNGEWLVGAWSPCQVGSDRARDAEGFCHGLRNRSAKCQVEGSDAPLDQCPRPRPSPEAACITTCPQDCVVGPWGEWVPCSSCNTSQRRTRSVVVAPTQGGSPCPPLSESRPCLGDCTPSGASSASLQEDTEPMVRLRVGEWGPCQPSPTIPNDPLEDDLGDPPEDNSISFLNSNEQETTFPEAAALQAVKEEDSGRSSTVRPSQVPEAWTDVDMPQVGRQERALTCVHLNGTLLSLR